MATRTRKKSGTGQDSYQVVTDLIIGALEAGIVPWHRPWRPDTAGRPMSLSSRKPYNGINVFVLGATAMIAGYDSPWWGTYKQIGERGGQVRKGEKSSPVVFWRFIERKDASGAVVDRIPLLKHFSVFNADQCDDLSVPASEPVGPPPNLITACEAISGGYRERGGPSLHHGGDQAYYSPLLDRVQMPKIAQFESAEHYYGALFHEYGHSTGCEKRLNRPNFESGRFGDPDYSREELVAEMTAAFVCGEAGIDVNVPHRAGYIAGWLSALGGDKKLVIAAGGAAQRAADLIIGRDREEFVIGLPVAAEEG